MQQLLAVKGTQQQVQELEVNVDTVYIRSNIERIETDDFTGWQYDEIQLALSKYHESVGNKVTSIEMDSADLWYELMTGGNV